MKNSTNQNLILIEGAATYERILTDLREVEIDEGIRHMKDFLKIYPDFARAHNDLAVMYYQTENSLKALAHYEKAHKLDPTNITYRKNLADFYFVELEWTGDAIHTYLDILKDNPFDIESLNSLGTISLHLGRKEQARQYFSRTLQIDTDNRDAQLALQSLPDPTSDSPATKQFQRMLSQVAPTSTPEPPPRPPASFQSLFNAISPPPQRTSEELYKDAQELAQGGNTSEALKILETLVAQDATNAIIHNDVAVLYQKSGESHKSRHHHEIAVRLNPDNIIFQKNLADLLCSAFGDFEAALAMYVKLYSDNRYDIEILKAISHICLKVDRPDDARFFLEQILTFKPWDQEASETLQLIKTSCTGNYCG